MTPAPLEAGFARCIITPPVGTPLRGFAGRGPSTGVHDELEAAVLVFRQGEVQAALLGIDLIGLDADCLAGIREAVAQAAGIPPEHQVYCCSHTHYGPELAERDPPPVMARYREELGHLLAGTVGRAVHDLAPVHLGYGEGRTDIGINRREWTPDGRVILGQNPTGPCDRSVGVVRLDRPDGRPLAAVVNVACHPVSGGSRTRGISAGWPGAMRRVVEQVAGVPVLFVQGAAGNLNSVEMEEGHAAALRLGQRCAGEVLAVWTRTATAAASGLAVVTRHLELPRYRYGSPARAQALQDELAAQLERTPEEQAGQRFWLELGLRRTAEVLADYRGEAPLPTVPAEITGWRIGPVALATAPAEIFCETGLAVKAHAPSPAALFGAYTNGQIGYVPVPEAYPEGGYEVDRACRVDPPAAGLIAEACVAAMREAWDAAA